MEDIEGKSMMGSSAIDAKNVDIVFKVPNTSFQFKKKLMQEHFNENYMESENGHTNETIHKNELDFKVDHRFGDIAGSNGGLRQFFGLDNSTDIRIGFEYGLSDRLTMGLARAKGATTVQQLYEGSLKYKLLEQTVDGRVPLAVTLFGSSTIAAVRANREDHTSASTTSHS